MVADPLGSAKQTLATSVLDKKCTENKNIHFSSKFCYPKIVPFCVYTARMLM